MFYWGTCVKLYMQIEIISWLHLFKYFNHFVKANLNKPLYQNIKNVKL